MPQTFRNVIVIRNGVVDENILVIGENDIIASGTRNGQKANDVAEELFLRYCRKIDSEFDETYPEKVDGEPNEEIDSILDDGCYECDNKCVCLTHPEIIG